jgi:hypothetical protein
MSGLSRSIWRGRVVGDVKLVAPGALQALDAPVEGRLGDELVEEAGGGGAAGGHGHGPS